MPWVLELNGDALCVLAMAPTRSSLCHVAGELGKRYLIPLRRTIAPRQGSCLARRRGALTNAPYPGLRPDFSDRGQAVDNRTAVDVSACCRHATRSVPAAPGPV